MRRLFVLLLCSLLYVQGLTQALQPPDKLYGALFRDVQLSGIFKDNKTFVDAVPRQHPDSIKVQYLQRKAGDTAGYSSLLPLPYPYIVPGGRFREIYYWDSYFTMLGLEERWIALNVKVYHNTGKLTEKYNVMDLSLPAGGGEYPNQDGFGWTNGVLLKLMDEYRYSVKQAPAK